MTAAIWKAVILGKPHICVLSWPGFSYISSNNDDVMSAARKSPYIDEQRENAGQIIMLQKKKERKKIVRKYLPFLNSFEFLHFTQFA